MARQFDQHATVRDQHIEITQDRLGGWRWRVIHVGGNETLHRGDAQSLAIAKLAVIEVVNAEDGINWIDVVPPSRYRG
jgi:hypothetical protein